MLPKMGRAGEQELEIALRYTLTGAHRCGLTHEYTQPRSQSHSQTWVRSWGQEPRTAAAFLLINPSLVPHRSGLGGGWEKEVRTGSGAGVLC